MIDLLRYHIHDTFWSLSYVVQDDSGFRSVQLLRFGWYECIALTALMVVYGLNSFHSALR